MRPILIAGPTASGKSGLALRLAEQLGGVVINADCMQVYRELRVLTARPGPEEEARVPHALYGFVPGAESYSAGRYAADVARVLEDARARRPPPDHRRRHRPLLQGADRGSVAHSGRSPTTCAPIGAARPPRRAPRTCTACSPSAIRRWRERLASGDTQRIVRALEVLDATGMSLAEWQRLPREPVLDLGRHHPASSSRSSATSWRGASMRAFAQMMEAGGLEEVLQLKALELDPALPLMTALGVRPLLAPPRRRAVARGGDRRRANRRRGSTPNGRSRGREAI